jgi:hypothetical protein
MDSDVKYVLNADIVLKQGLKDIQNIDKGVELIFDANILKYKEIIEFMDINYVNMGKLVTYKIHPKEANFILGSDNSIGRGEVVVF